MYAGLNFKRLICLGGGNHADCWSSVWFGLQEVFGIFIERHRHEETIFTASKEGTAGFFWVLGIRYNFA